MCQPFAELKLGKTADEAPSLAHRRRSFGDKLRGYITSGSCMLSDTSLHKMTDNIRRKGRRLFGFWPAMDLEKNKKEWEWTHTAQECGETKNKIDPKKVIPTMLRSSELALWPPSTFEHMQASGQLEANMTSNSWQAKTHNHLTWNINWPGRMFSFAPRSFL